MESCASQEQGVLKSKGLMRHGQASEVCTHGLCPYGQGLPGNCKSLDMNLVELYTGLGTTAKKRGQPDGR